MEEEPEDIVVSPSPSMRAAAIPYKRLMPADEIDTCGAHRKEMGMAVERPQSVPNLVNDELAEGSDGGRQGCAGASVQAQMMEITHWRNAMMTEAASLLGDRRGS